MINKGSHLTRNDGRTFREWFAINVPETVLILAVLVIIAIIIVITIIADAN